MGQKGSRSRQNAQSAEGKLARKCGASPSFMEKERGSKGQTADPTVFAKLPLPVEVAARVLEWTTKGEWLAARRTSKLWLLAVSCLMDTHLSSETINGQWAPTKRNTVSVRVILCSAPFMSLTTLHSVVTIDLAGWNLVAKKELSLIAANFEHLESVTSDSMTDAGMVEISNMRGLRSLVVRDFGDVNDDVAVNIAKLTELRTLHLPRCRLLGNDSMKAITKLHSLTSLDLTGCSVNYRGATEPSVRTLANLANLVNLTYLNLTRCEYITNAVVLKVAKLDRLTSLSLASCGAMVGDVGIAAISGIVTLTSLDLSQLFITDASIRKISQMPTMRAVSLAGCRYIENPTWDIARISSLTALNLSRCVQVTDEMASKLRVLHQLTLLDLSWCHRITDASLMQLGQLPQLTSLNLNSCVQVSDVGAREVSKIPTLTVLSLEECSEITESCLQQIEELLNSRLVCSAEPATSYA